MPKQWTNACATMVAFALLSTRQTSAVFDQCEELLKVRQLPMYMQADSDRPWALVHQGWTGVG